MPDIWSKKVKKIKISNKIPKKLKKFKKSQNVEKKSADSVLILKGLFSADSAHQMHKNAKETHFQHPKVIMLILLILVLILLILLIFRFWPKFDQNSHRFPIILNKTGKTLQKMGFYP